MSERRAASATSQRKRKDEKDRRVSHSETKKKTATPISATTKRGQELLRLHINNNKEPKTAKGPKHARDRFHLHLNTQIDQARYTTSKHGYLAVVMGLLFLEHVREVAQGHDWLEGRRRQDKNESGETNGRRQGFRLVPQSMYIANHSTKNGKPGGGRWHCLSIFGGAILVDVILVFGVAGVRLGRTHAWWQTTMAKCKGTTIIFVEKRVVV